MNDLNVDLKSHSNIKDINTKQALLHLMQINDSAFPIGGFAHSFGMETYIQENTIRNKNDLWSFCNMYLQHNLASADGIIVKEANELAKKGDLDGLLYLENICHGLKLSPESRQASMMMGRQFIQTMESLYANECFPPTSGKLKLEEMKGHYAVAYGMYTGALHIPVQTAVEAFFYSSLVTLVQNAVRAIPLGQISGVQTIFQLLPAIEEAAKNVITLNLNDLNNNSIALEIASMKHGYLFSRLFIS